jgi:hypothetical protein
LLLSFDSGFFLFLFPLRASDPFFCGWQNGRFKLFQALIGAIRFDPASFGLVFLGVAIDDRESEEGQKLLDFSRLTYGGFSNT